MNADQIIEILNLTPLPEEGGYFRESYRAKACIPNDALPDHEGSRNFSTLIYYLVTREEFSGLHRVKASDEIFHFYLGDPVEMVQITEDGDLNTVIMGQNIPEQSLQTVVSSNVWQGTQLVTGGKWALLGCSVAPGFDYADFDIKTQKEFLNLFPQHEEVVKRFTRENH